jgi:DNA-binding PadR family transcriptional regulator
MSLPDILLSLLRQPMSGTDLIRLFEGIIRHFWKTDLSQIYRALDALERDGCLRSEMLPSSRGPERRVYALTDAGRHRLMEWIRRPATIPAAKFEYLAQLFSVTADEQPRERARELLRSMRGEAERSVQILEAIDALFRRQLPEDMHASVFYPWLTLRHGLIRRRGLLEWIDECLGHLELRSGEEEQDLAGEAVPELARALQSIAKEAGLVEPAKDD